MCWRSSPDRERPMVRLKRSTAGLNICAGLLWGSVTSPTTSPGVCSSPVASDRFYTLNYDEPLKRAWAEADHSTVPDDLIEALHKVQFQGVTGSFHFDNGRRKALCYPFDTDDPTIGQPCLTFAISHGRSVPLDV